MHATNPRPNLIPNPNPIESIYYSVLKFIITLLQGHLKMKCNSYLLYVHQYQLLNF